MILLLLAAPLIALGMPRERANRSWAIWASGLAFFVALWVWHMPVPYDGTFESSRLYWIMHTTLFGSGIVLWRELLHHPPRRTAEALIVGLLTTMQMGLLGAVLALAVRPLFFPHLLTTVAWGLTPLQDQQLGGTLMWVPGVALFLWAAMRSLRRVWRAVEEGSDGASRLS
jgi:putative membrane protein